jgi:hypothetical protein
MLIDHRQFFRIIICWIMVLIASKKPWREAASLILSIRGQQATPIIDRSDIFLFLQVNELLLLLFEYVLYFIVCFSSLVHAPAAEPPWHRFFNYKEKSVTAPHRFFCMSDPYCQYWSRIVSLLQCWSESRELNHWWLIHEIHIDPGPDKSWTSYLTQTFASKGLKHAWGGW